MAPKWLQSKEKLLFSSKAENTGKKGVADLGMFFTSVGVNHFFGVSGTPYEYNADCKKSKFLASDYPVQPLDHFSTKYVYDPCSEKNLFHFKVCKWLLFSHFAD